MKNSIEYEPFLTSLDFYSILFYFLIPHNETLLQVIIIIITNKGCNSIIHKPILLLNIFLRVL